MASTALHFLFRPSPFHVNQLVPSLNPQASTNPSQLLLNGPHRKHFSIECTGSESTPQPDFPSPSPSSDTLNKAESFPIEKRRKSEIIRDRKATTGLVMPEPPNFEIGWKRTKEINLEKPKGYIIADFLEKLEGLMGREFGTTELLAKAGEIVAERAREEAEVLRDEGKVEERMITEFYGKSCSLGERLDKDYTRKSTCSCDVIN
ncbi:hypothetical protein CJ030_MR0G008024 [Morella rubra]|uniref:Uncharacterized protein n=1 Tax=Morella rubra TaxID=262757 RepID=A0A6A1UJZ1_9ROSI|nr:hypothetical protein CJ030_MR0G008024 [Morella rubra]